MMRRLTALVVLVTLLYAPLLTLPAQAAVSGSVSLTIDLQDTRTSGSESATQTIKQLFRWNVASGTGADQANLCWTSTRTLTTGANEDLDLSGSLTNLFGAAVFTVQKLIAISAAAANTTSLTVSRPATNGVPFLVAAGDAFVLGAGDFSVLTRRSTAGVTVTAATGDLINVLNSSGASATYTVTVCGLS